MVVQYQISKTRACKCVLLASMIFYKHHLRDETASKIRIREIASTRIRYGFKRIYTLLRREGFTDNHKRFYRFYRAEVLNLRIKRPRRNRSANHRLERLNHLAINQVWSMDYVQDALFNRERFRVFTLVDNYSKICHGFLVGKSL